MTLHLSPDLDLPLQAVTEKFAILAQSGAGKTYTAHKLAELMLGAGAQIIALDPVGNWWCLRSAADGKSPGLPITVFGGQHGDVPLSATSGKLIARILAQRPVSAVLDVSGLTTSETKTFAGDFAEEFFQAKKAFPSPVHLFLEEAQTFAPQIPADRSESAMLNNFDRLLKLGRNYGVGWTMISQAPQAANKRCLNQAGTVIALRTIGRHEKKAIIDWVNEKASADGDLDLAATLPSLEIGVAHVWSPGWLRVSKTVRIAQKITFDASMTPKIGVAFRAPQVLAPVDVAALLHELKEVGSTAQDAKADPAALRRRVAELEAELACRPDPEPAVSQPVFTDDERAKLDALAGQLHRIQADLHSLVEAACRSLPPPAVPTIAAPPKLRAVPRVPPAPAKDTAGLKRGARDMLVALASLHPRPLTRSQVATLAGLSPNGGTFSSYLSSLRSGGFITETGSEITLTAAGIAQAGPQTPPATTAELVALWSARLKAGARKMLHALVESHPQGFSRDALGTRTDIAHTGGTFSSYLSSLRSNGLIEERGSAVFASSSLFIESPRGRAARR